MTTKLHTLSFDTQVDPNDFQILISSVEVENIQVSADRVTAWGITYGPLLYFRGVPLKPPDARALVEVLTVALDAIDNRMQPAAPTTAKAEADAPGDDAQRGVDDRKGDAGYSHCIHCNRSTVQIFDGKDWVCEVCGWGPTQPKATKAETVLVTSDGSISAGNTPGCPPDCNGSSVMQPLTTPAAKVRLSAANSVVCRNVKRTYNAKIYSLFLNKANSEGIAGAVRWLTGGYVTPEHREQAEADLYRSER